MRMSGVRLPLHDPYAERALVLFTPPELSAHEQMKVCGGRFFIYNFNFI
jgi:hypothetical protein